MTDLVVAATDGSAINNPRGPAGWAWFVSENCWAAGGFEQASNQVAELFAVLALLRAVPKEFDLLVRTDSQFVVNVMTKWLSGWRNNGWKKADGNIVANVSLIQDLDRSSFGRKVDFEWVRGHSGDSMNEIADKICGAASDAVRRGRTDLLLRGPGWTGYSKDPVVPNLSSVRQPVQTRLVGEKISESDIRNQGYGANAKVVRVTAKTPRSPERQKFEICKSCDGPIHPLTLHCRCGSM